MTPLTVHLIVQPCHDNINGIVKLICTHGVTALNMMPFLQTATATSRGGMLGNEDWMTPIGGSVYHHYVAELAPDALVASREHGSRLHLVL